MGNCSYFLPSLHGPLGLHRQQSILHHPRSGLAVQEWKVAQDFARSKASPMHSRGRLSSHTRTSSAVAVIASAQGGTQCFVFGQVKLSSSRYLFWNLVDLAGWTLSLRRAEWLNTRVDELPVPLCARDSGCCYRLSLLFSFQSRSTHYDDQLGCPRLRPCLLPAFNRTAM